MYDCFFLRSYIKHPLVFCKSESRDRIYLALHKTNVLAKQWVCFWLSIRILFDADQDYDFLFNAVTNPVPYPVLEFSSWLGQACQTHERKKLSITFNIS